MLTAHDAADRCRAAGYPPTDPVAAEVGKLFAAIVP